METAEERILCSALGECSLAGLSRHGLLRPRIHRYLGVVDSCILVEAHKGGAVYECSIVQHNLFGGFVLGFLFLYRLAYGSNLFLVLVRFLCRDLLCPVGGFTSRRNYSLLYRYFLVHLVVRRLLVRFFDGVRSIVAYHPGIRYRLVVWRVVFCGVNSKCIIEIYQPVAVRLVAASHRLWHLRHVLLYFVCLPFVVGFIVRLSRHLRNGIHCKYRIESLG